MDRGILVAECAKSQETDCHQRGGSIMQGNSKQSHKLTQSVPGKNANFDHSKNKQTE